MSGGALIVGRQSTGRDPLIDVEVMLDAAISAAPMEFQDAREEFLTEVLERARQMPRNVPLVYCPELGWVWTSTLTPSGTWITGTSDGPVVEPLAVSSELLRWKKIECG